MWATLLLSLSPFVPARTIYEITQRFRLACLLPFDQRLSLSSERCPGGLFSYCLLLLFFLLFFTSIASLWVIPSWEHTINLNPKQLSLCCEWRSFWLSCLLPCSLISKSVTLCDFTALCRLWTETSLLYKLHSTIVMLWLFKSSFLLAQTRDKKERDETAIRPKPPDEFLLQVFILDAKSCFL